MSIQETNRGAPTKKETPSAEPDIEEILSAFETDRLESTKVSALYRLGLLAVAVAMVFLPLVYLGIIVSTAWGVVYHAVHHTDLMSASTGGGGGAVLAYLAPIIVGPIAILFMVKPLFARRGEVDSSLLLKEDEAPALKLFVRRICEAVGAPQPKEIEIDCQVNAAASFRRGWLSLFGQDLKLIVGLPLVAGMSLRSFGGVLAHEFGHFAQGAGMRLTFVIRNINNWFSRVVYERDRWDAWLEGTAKSVDLRIGIVLYLALFMVWLTRRLLWVLMWIGHLLSCFALRQMEYDADAWEARLAGGEHFKETCERLQLLGLGNSRAIDLLGETWKEKRLAENLPDLIRDETDELPAEAVARFQTAVAESKTGLFDTHPADSDRVAAVLGLNAPGAFHLEAPATALFADWSRTARRVTEAFYSRAIGSSVCDDNLVSNRQLQNAGHKAANQAVDRYFLGKFSCLRPLFLAQEDLASEGRATEQIGSRIRAAAEELKALAEAGKSDFVRFDMADQARLNAWQAHSLVEAGHPAAARARGLSNPSGENAFQELELSATEMRQSREPLGEFDALARERLIAALSLPGRDGIHFPPPADADALREEIARFVAAMGALKPVYPQLLQLREALAAQRGLFEQLREENEERFIGILRDNAAALSKQTREVRRSLGDAPYPFEHANGNITLARFMTVETDRDMDVIFRQTAEAENAVERLMNLYLRILGRLVLIAEKAEAAIEGGTPAPQA